MTISSITSALADCRGGVVRFEGDWSPMTAASSSALAGVDARLRRVAALTVAVGAAPAGLTFDLRTDDPRIGDRWIAGFDRSPGPALAAALLVREPPASIWTGLVAESSTYSMLQGGPQFREWREQSEAQPADDRDAPRIRVTTDGDVVEIVLTRPARHNALDVPMRDQLYDALVALELGGAGPVIVRGEGPSFCSGGDLGEFGTFPDPVAAHAVRLARSLALRFADLGSRMIVGIHGRCLGSGIELPAFASRVVAADDTEIGLPEASLGLIPGAGGTVSIPRRSGSQRLLELLLTSDRIDASTALDWGLVDEVVPRALLETRIRALAQHGAAQRRSDNG